MSDTIIIKMEGLGEPIAFILNTSANPGKVVCYSHIGQHSEADVYYMNHECLWSHTPQDIIKAYALVQELKSIGYVIEE